MTTELNYRAVVFDFDGVLVRSEHVNEKAAEKTFRDMGVSLLEAELATIPGRASMHFIPPILARCGVTDPERVQAVITQNRANYDALWGTMVELMDGAEQVIPELYARRIVLAIATSNRRAIVERFYERFRMRQYFAFAVTSKDVQQHKPHPEVYDTACNRIGFPRRHIIAVEDTETGITSAKASGVRCVAFPNEHSRNHNFSQADLTITTLAELLSI